MQMNFAKMFFSYVVKPDALEKCKTGSHFLNMRLENWG